MDKKWIDDAFPKVISILDYHYPCEHLHAFSGSIFNAKAKEKMWIDKQKEWLLKGEIACHQKTQMPSSLAQRSILFENAFVSSPLCSPSRQFI